MVPSHRVSGGSAVQIDLRSHPSRSARRETSAPPARAPSPVFTLQKHIIHLFTHLSVLRAAGIVRLIELPEACAAGYHARRSPYFALSDARRGCAGCMLFISYLFAGVVSEADVGSL